MEDMEVDAVEQQQTLFQQQIQNNQENITNNNNHTNSERRFTKRLAVKNSIQASFGTPDNPDYIFQISGSQDGSIMAVSLSTNEIKLYSAHTGQHMGDLKGHTDTINEIAFWDSDAHLLQSCSADGTIRIWDSRDRLQATILQGDGSEIFSLSIGGMTDKLIAAGSSAKIIFWDMRYSKQIACLEECHMEDVTQVLFHPVLKSKLVSGSVDGLLCSINTEGNINDDEQLESVLNAGTSVGRFGFFGAAGKSLWCLTHIQSLSIWDWGDASQKALFDNARSVASGNWDLPEVDYFVECQYSPESDNLWLVGGTNEGSLGYFPVNYSESHINGENRIGPASAALQGGHSDVIRCVWPHIHIGSDSASDSPVFVWTGGEDGRLCYWSEVENPTTKEAWISPSLVMKSSKITKQFRHRPY